MTAEYENMRRVAYGTDDDEIGQAVFVPVCEKCGRFVRADEECLISPGQGLSTGPNATCSRCGRTRMLFEGFY